jgi:hypothetical protein
MAQVQAKSQTSPKSLTIKKRRTYEDTLNNLAHYLENNKKK